MLTKLRRPYYAPHVSMAGTCCNEGQLVTIKTHHPLGTWWESAGGSIDYLDCRALVPNTTLARHLTKESFCCSVLTKDRENWFWFLDLNSPDVKNRYSGPRTNNGGVEVIVQALPFLLSKN
jgi:hypothetical protein